MLKLKPIKSEKVWGYENWIASVYPSMEQSDLVNICTKDFPLLIKVIQANDTLSVQVHPNDKDAISIEGNGNRGKTECWLILDATPDATIVYGLKNNQYSTDELKNAIENNCLENYLNVVKVQKGDFIFIPAGTVHAIGGGLRLLEVQQSCDLTYRLYDWGRPREVHISKGLKVINESENNKISKLENDFECEYFSLKKKKVETSCIISSKSITKNFSDYKFYFVLNGKGKVKNNSVDKTQDEFDLNPEDIFLVTPNDFVEISGNVELIEIVAK